MTLDEALRRIQPVDREIATAVQARLDRLTKPLGSLGRLEETAVRYATITGEVKPNVPRGWCLPSPPITVWRLKE